MPPDQIPAPWTADDALAIIAWQSDPQRHPLTCETHSHMPLAVGDEGLFCLADGCEYTQAWVPSVVVRRG